MINYEKILIFQYGKVGSSSIRQSDSNSNYYSIIQKNQMQILWLQLMGMVNFYQKKFQIS